MKFDGVLCLMADILFERHRKPFFDLRQQGLIGFYNTQRRFKILVRDGKEIVETGVGCPDDDIHIRLRGFLQLFVRPGIDRTGLFQIVGRGDQTFDRFAGVL